MVRILGLNISSKKPDVSIHNPESSLRTFYETAKKSPGGSEVLINEKDEKGIAKNQTSIPMPLFLQIESLENYIRSELGGGIFVLQIRDPAREIIGSHIVAVGGKKHSEKTESEKAQGQASDYMGPKWVMTILDKALDKAFGSNGAQQTSNPVVDKMADAFLASVMQPQPDFVDQLDKYAQVSKFLTPQQPKIETDQTATIIAVIGQILSFLMNRGQVSPAMLSGLQQSLTDQVSQAQALPPGISQQPTSTPLAAPRGATPLESPVTSSKNVPLGNPPDNAHHAEFYNSHVKKLIEMISRNETPDKVARFIVMMVEYEGEVSPDDPHPLVRGFISATNFDELQAAYQYLVKSTPGMSANLELQTKVGINLTKYIADLYSQVPETETGEEVEDDTGEQNISDNESIYTEESEQDGNAPG